MVHVRRGDYLLKSEHGLLDADYYQKAINKLPNLSDKAHFLVFSDAKDKQKLTELFGRPVIFFEDSGFSAVEVLSFMASCDFFVAANSTLSWWASYIGGYGRAQVVAVPSAWHKTMPIEVKDLFPPEWIVV
jgi:hypothetical protein